MSALSKRNRVVPAIEVHHLIPFGDSWELFIALKSRCRQCHAEAHGRRNPAKHRVIGLDGWPVEG